VTARGRIPRSQRGWQVKSGVAFTVAAVVKLFPILIGVWLLSRRAWRAIAAAVATGSALVLSSLLIFGLDVHLRYVRFILTERSRLDRFDGTFTADFFGMTLSRPLSVLFPELDPASYTLIAAAAFVPVLWVLYRGADSESGRLVAFGGTLVAILLVSPASNLNHVLYLYFPLVTLVFTLEHDPSRRLLLVGLFVLSFPFHLPQIYSFVNVLGLSPGLQHAVFDVAVPILTVGTITLYGLGFVVAGCLAHALWRPRGRRHLRSLGDSAD